MMVWMKYLLSLKTNIVELKDKNINEFTVDPKDLGVNMNNKNNLIGKNGNTILQK